MPIINFIFVYVVSGFIISLFIKHFANDTIDRKLSLILGFGISPLLISLFLYYLYLFFPGNKWGFYAIIIYIIFFIAAIFLKKQFLNLIRNIKLSPIFNIPKFFSSPEFNKKILLFFVLFVMLFTITRNVFYHTTYTDAFEYMKQGFIYSQDRSLGRLITNEPFSNFDEKNSLYGPAKEFITNAAIRPALPIFYSFFYINDTPDSFIFSSIEFLYSYYFVLIIFSIIYILSRFKRKNILIGLTILLSCYFLTKLSYSNYKEIIISYYSLLSLFILYELNKNKNWAHAIILGALCGLMGYINFSGLVVSGLIFLLGLLFFKSAVKKKISVISVILFIFVIFSGNEILQYNNFIFNKSLVSFGNWQKTFESEEFTTRLEMEKKTDTEKLDILITKKLQGFTQIQVFGLIFWLFLIILILLLIKKIKIDDFSKLNLFFIFLFFMVFSDPFFINPHEYAYVLSLGYRYTTILAFFVAIFIALNYDVFLDAINKIKIKYLKLIIFLSILLFTPIRTYASEKILKIISKIFVLTNSYEYYLKKVDSFLIIFAFFSIIIFIFLFFYQNYQKKVSDKKLPDTMNNLFLVVFFIIPFLFTLNNNQNIINTFRYSFEKNISYKLEKTARNEKEREAFGIINYINKNIEKDTKIIIDTTIFGSAQYNFWFYLNNNQRLIKQTNGEFPANVDYEKFYFLTSQKSYEDIKENCINKKTFFSVFLLECNTR